MIHGVYTSTLQQVVSAGFKIEKGFQKSAVGGSREVLMGRRPGDFNDFTVVVQ